jgi:hypothetical protein
MSSYQLLYRGVSDDWLDTNGGKIEVMDSYEDVTRMIEGV